MFNRNHNYLKMMALWYSCTCFTVTNRERGKVQMMRIMERTRMSPPTKLPHPLSSAS